jgi:hypothetical protein
MTALQSTDGLFSGLGKLWDEGERDLAGLEPAWGKAAFFFRTGHRLGHGPNSMRCMSLLEVYRMLDVYRKRFEDGDTLSLLQAISMCAEENMPMPEWLALAFHTRMTAFGRPGAPPSLDDVFCSKEMPTKSPKKAAQARQDWQLGGLLWRDAWNLVIKDESLASFDRVITKLLAAKKYGAAKTKAKKLILMVDTSQAQFLGKPDTLPRFLEKRRKLMT